MAEQQWEYCALYIYSWDVKNKKYFANLGIRYFGDAGNYYDLAAKKGPHAKGYDYNPWSRALGELGAAGWELVSVQHGNKRAGTSSKGLILDHAVAYFKRPIQPGRPIDEPKLVMP